jgi:hypothetical protein
MLKNDGLVKEAEKINFLLHKVAWTTSSELFGELKNTFSNILTQNSALSQPAKAKLNLFIAAINTACSQSNGKL